MIRLNRINKFYNKGKSNQIHVVNDTTLELPEKGLVALLGKSGSGKTTLLNVIGGLDSYHSGVVEIDGTIINRYNSKVWDALRSKRIGYVFQNYYLIEDKTVFENLEISLRLAGLMDKEEITRRIEYSLGLVGLLKYKNRTPNTLSGGQQQRVGIARALVKGPSIIIADEPTGNLDSDNTFEIMDILKSISKNCLVVLVTHEEQIANFFADRIIRLVDGAIAEDYINESIDDLSVSDNKTIYLQDLDKQWEYDGDKILVTYRGDGDKKINIDLIERDGRLYINALNSALPITLIDEKSEVRVADAKLTDKKKGEHKSIEVNGDIIGPIQADKQKTAISNRESFKQAWQSYRLTSRKIRNRASLGIMFLMSIIITVVFAIAGGSLVFDESSYTKNKDLVMIGLNDSNDNEIIGELYELDYVDTVVLSAVIFHPTISNMPDLFADSSYNWNVLDTYNLSLLQDSKIIHGRMPESEQECVIDIRSAEKYIKDSLSSAVGGEGFLLGEMIRLLARTRYEFTIVGIIDGGYEGAWIEDDRIYDVISANDYASSDIKVITNDIDALEEWAGNRVWRVENQYDLAKSEFRFIRNEMLVVLLTLISISIVVMAFISAQTIKSSFINRVKEIGTLRCIGVSKSEIIRDFIFENLIRLTLSIVTGIALVGVFLSSFSESLKMILMINLYSKFPVYIISLVVLGGIFMGLSYLNINRLLRRTPAEIMSKYDI